MSGPNHTTLIVGASRGIGLELARQYADAGWTVHATTRSRRDPGPLGELRGDVHLHQLEVRRAEDIAALAHRLEGTALDVAIHNAGISARGHADETVFEVNSLAPFEVTTAIIPALLRAKDPKLVLVTSQLGARRGGRASLDTYGESKARLNDRFRELAPAWAERGLCAIVLHPGWVRTDMGGAGAPVSAEDSARGIIAVVNQLGPHSHGKFLTWEGAEHPW